MIKILTSGGATAAWYEYDAWGNVVSVGGNASIANLNPIRYRGYYYDAETGFYYLNSRYYDPEICRFINADDIVSSVGELAGYNLFAYGLNNPISLEDRSGNWPDWNQLINGVAMVAMGVAALATAAAVAVTAVAALPAVGLAIAATAVTATYCVTMGGYDVVESFTGQNAMKAAMGEENYYAAEAFVGTVATAGAATLSQYVPQQNCFVAGTPVLTAGGLKAIEEIQPGDTVWAADPETGEQSVKEVVQTFVNETDELVHISVAGEEIVTTPEHPFYIPQKGWAEAISLRAGDILVLANGEYVTVEKVQHEILELPVKVYNFEVEDYHTYYAGVNSVLVHNKCKGSDHGNSLSTTKPAKGYILRDKKNFEILKFGETTRGEKRYSQGFLERNNAFMDFVASGTKAEMHAWQHEQIVNYVIVTGQRPRLNFCLY